MLMKLTPDPINILQAAFMLVDLEIAKKTNTFTVFIALSG